MELFRRFVLPLTGAALLMVSCSRSDDDPAVPPPPPQDDLPELSDMASLRGETSAPPEAPVAVSPTGSSVAKTDLNGVQPSATGLYVLQVGVWDNGPSARKQSKDLQASGIPTYVVKVENPGGLQGEFWRVRVGYFPTVPAARAYGENLKAKGIAFWIDNKSNDDVGAPGAPAAAPPANDYPTAVMEAPSQKEVVAAPAPAPQAAAPAPAVAPAAAPAPAPQAAAPAPAAAPTPAAAPAPAAPPQKSDDADLDDGWD